MSDKIFLVQKRKLVMTLNMTKNHIGGKKICCQIFHFSKFLPLDGACELLIK